MAPRDYDSEKGLESGGETAGTPFLIRYRSLLGTPQPQNYRDPPQLSGPSPRYRDPPSCF